MLQLFYIVLASLRQCVSQVYIKQTCVCKVTAVLRHSPLTYVLYVCVCILIIVLYCTALHCII